MFYYYWRWWKKASEPSGEGAFIVDVIGNGGGGHFLILFILFKFRSGVGAGDDFLDPSRVESIDTGSHRYLALKQQSIDRAQ